MIGLTLFKRFTLLTTGCLLAVLSVLAVTLPANAAPTSTTGEIQGGKYFVSITYPDQSVEKAYLTGDNTTITLTPDPPGDQPISINNGQITISNVPPGAYSVGVKFKVDRDACDHADENGNKEGGFGQCTISGIKGANDRHFSFTTSYSAIVQANQITYLQNQSDTGTARSIGNAVELNADGSPRVNCGGKGILMSFVICPMIENILGIMDWLVTSFIQPYLIINPLQASDASGQASQLYIIWNNIRNFANIVFVLTFFVIIFSQATSIGITNYGIKRLLPRLILIAIGTNVSFFVCAFLVDVFNVLGAGASSLLVNAILNGSATINLGNVDLIIALFATPLAAPFGAVLIAAAAPIIFGIFVFLIIAAAIILMAAVVILLRQIIIIFLVLASPLAFVAGLLPNTQKLFSQWFTAFLKLLAMYPIVMVLFAAGKVASTVLNKVGPVGEGAGPQAVLAIISMLAFVLPMVMIPFAFKFAGSGLSKIYGSIQNGVQNARKSASKAAVKGAKMTPWGQEAQQHWNAYKAGKVRQAADSASRRRTSTGLLGNIIRRANGPAGTELADDDYRARTMKSAEKMTPHALGDLARMNRGETVDSYIGRNSTLNSELTSTATDPESVRKRNNAQQRVADLREGVAQFGGQLGTDQFREAILREALKKGANTEDMHQAMQAHVSGFQGSDTALTQSMTRVMQEAKGAGFAEYSGVGYQTDPTTGARTFSQYQIKGPDSILRNIKYEGQEAGQFVVQNADSSAVKGRTVGNRTELGDGVFRRLSGAVDPTSGSWVAASNTDRMATLRRIAVGGKDGKALAELTQIAREADADLASRGLTGDNVDELNRMISTV